jgi:hypothetical protein
LYEGPLDWEEWRAKYDTRLYEERFGELSPDQERAQSGDQRGEQSPTDCGPTLSVGQATDQAPAGPELGADDGPDIGF